MNTKKSQNISVISKEEKEKIKKEYTNFLNEVKQLRIEQQEVIDKYKKAIKKILNQKDHG